MSYSRTDSMMDLSLQTRTLIANLQSPILAAEMKRLDALLGAALLDETVCARLLHKCDETLFDDYTISENTRQFLREVRVQTLTEMAQAIVDYCHPKPRIGVLTKAS